MQVESERVEKVDLGIFRDISVKFSENILPSRESKISNQV